MSFLILCFHKGKEKAIGWPFVQHLFIEDLQKCTLERTQDSSSVTCFLWVRKRLEQERERNPHFLSLSPGLMGIEESRGGRA